MKLFLIGIILLLSSELSAQENNPPIITNRDSIINYAQTLVGTPYLWAGTSKKGFDCSGFVYYVFKHFNKNVPRTSRGFKGKGTTVNLTAVKPADILLFTGTNSNIREIGHVGIVLKNENGTIDFIHSSSSKKHYGVTISRYNGTGYEKRFLRATNILS